MAHQISTPGKHEVLFPWQMNSNTAKQIDILGGKESSLLQRRVVSYIHFSLHSEILLLSVAKRRGQDFFFLWLPSGLAGPRTDR